VGHEAPGRPDLTISEDRLPLLPRQQWDRFCHNYAIRTGNEYFLTEWTAYVGHCNKTAIGTAQWAAWLRWVAVYKLTGDGRGSFITEEG
jgi:hypothetical protein